MPTNERSRTIEGHVINTTSGPRAIPKGVREDVHPDHTLNTTAAVEENLEYTDQEPEIISIVPAGDWCAVLEAAEGSRVIPLAVWVALDDGSMYGVAPHGGEGNIDLTRSIADDPQFQTYTIRKGDR